MAKATLVGSGGLKIDPKSGYCNTNCTYYSKRKQVTFPQDEYLDLPTFISSQNHSGQIALIDFATGEKIPYRQVWQNVRSLAAGLLQMGVKKGDVILLVSANSVHFPIISIAIMSIGAIVTTTNPLNTAREIGKQAADSEAMLAFVTPELRSKLAHTNLPLVLISTEDYVLPSDVHQATNSKNVSIRSLTELMASDTTQMPNVKIHQDDTATLLYSSGTTGVSKGVLSTHRNLISLVCVVLTRFKKATFVCTVPMFHIYGFGAFVCGSLASGSTTVVLSKFELSDMLGAVEKYRANYLPLVPPILVALTKTDISSKYGLGSLDTVLCGGAPLDKEATQEFISKFPNIALLQGFAMTETMGMGASMDTVEESRHYGSVGMISPNIEAKIVDPESGIDLPPNQRGELWLRGPSIMKGYFSNPEATSSALDKNGWLHTGDICYIDTEGYVFVVDRLKELIKYKAYQIAPAELEAILLSHSEIADAAVIPFPDKEAGQVPMAYVVRKQGSTLSEATVIDFVAKQVAPYKKVRRVAFVNGIPKTAVGKILRKDLIKLSTSKL
ncbi:probable CoA ligase CCL5 [Cryptomeria japonica]|uniref:probable CoA ligase CCL5 n=1 Tax=Cryptomeria japonica TaxID=3369 RepID=UPI0027DA11AE|nr:probable CoA ligase CCL5 [Cryptomeria japonica]